MALAGPVAVGIGCRMTTKAPFAFQPSPRNFVLVVRGWVLTKVPELIGGGPERLAHLLQPKPVVHKQGTESQYLLPPKMKVRRVHFDWDS